MERNSRCSAVILNLRSVSENNRVVTFLSNQRGIETALLYGGPKSKLRSLVAPFTSGTLWVYTNKNSSKITDFHGEVFRNSFRESLFKSWAATFCAELLIKTAAGGTDFEKIFSLINVFFDGMDRCNDGESRKALIRFLWRYQIFLGENPSTDKCCHCGCALNQQAVFSPYPNGFLCRSCAAKNEFSHHGLFRVNASGMNYLKSIERLSPGKSRALEIDEDTLQQLKKLLFFLCEKSCNQKMQSVKVNFF